MKKLNSFIIVALKVITYIPFLWIVLIYSYCVRIKINYGSCPNLKIENPETLYVEHNNLIGYSLNYGWYFIMIFFMFIFLKLFKIDYVNKSSIIRILVGLLIIFIMVFIQPFSALWVLGD
jgi:hypothetical protein